MKSRYCKLDDQSKMTFRLENVNGQTFMTIVDTKCKHELTMYKGFANIGSYVDKYRLLELADFIYDYCNEDK